MTYQSGYGFPADVIGDRARMERLFERKWFFVGMRADVAKKRDFLKFDLLGEEYFLIHGNDGVIRCYVNRCAHQSARLVKEDSGRCAARIICPNHQWAFDPNSGDVVHASFMPDDFVGSEDCRRFSLKEIPLRETGLMLFACLGDAAPQDEMDLIATTIAPYMNPFVNSGHGYKQAYHHREVMDASWLLAMLNNRECCHCAQNHKRLLALFDPSSFNGEHTEDYAARLKAAQARWETKGLAWKEQAFNTSENIRISRYPMGEGFKSQTFDGKLASQKLIGPFAGGEPDEGTLSFWLNPNAWVHFVSDHIIANWILPLSEDKCAFYTSWIVHEEAVEGVDYTAKHMKEVWLVTNEEDVALCQSMSQGARSKYYKPGPFAPPEQFCKQFADWYLSHST